MSSKITSTFLGLSLAVVVVVLVVLRVTGVFPPIDKKTELIGTMGGVEKADKFRGNQFSFKDVKFDNPEFAEFVQSADFQNAMKDPNFRTLMTNQEFVKYLVPLMETNKVLDNAAQDLQKFLSNAQNFKVIFTNQSFKATADAMDLKNLDLRSSIYNQIEQAVQFGQLPKAFEAPNLFEVQQMVHNRDFQVYVGSAEMKNMVPMSQDFYAVCSQDFQKFAYMATDFNMEAFKSLFSSQEFQKLALNPGLTATLSSQEFQKQFGSQDFQKIVLNQDFQKAILCEP